MLTQIASKPPAGAPGGASLAEALQAGDNSDAVDLLLGCHQRIRHFTAMALRLAAADAPRDQIGTAAGAVHRYYSVALPLHEADENQSVYPRLRAALAASGSRLEADANQAMLDQHVEIDKLVDILLPQWAGLAEHPETAPATAATVEKLNVAWKEHLELEERVVFPALRAHLSQGDRDAIRQEMAQRRRLHG
ncbi:MAG TPA: hemerythrin domain-containing protein [Terriglobales bacterium]|nr:hemerythrin domain-containing protein [Terriglobales bacterium]